MDKEILDILVCPKCKGELKLESMDKKEIINGKLICQGCDAEYLIENGIPLLYYSPMITLQEKVREMFDLTPYGLVGMKDALNHMDEITEEVIEESPYYIHDDIKGKNILDAGCGGGHLYAKMRLLGANVVGLDQSPNSLFTLQEIFKTYGLIPALVNGNIEYMPFKEEIFDVVTCMGVLHHSENTARGLLELGKSLKKGGNLHIMVYHKHCLWGYVKEFLRFLATHSGLATKIIRKLTPAWSGCTAEQSDDETVFRDNIINPITKRFSIKEVKEMCANTDLRIEEIDIHELPLLYVFGKRIYKSRFLRWYEKRFGWLMYVKMKRI